jgi:hypothetical protein
MTSSFTAINATQFWLATSQSSATLLGEHNKVRDDTTSTRRRRNSTIARYLGLDSFEAPVQLAPSRNGPRSPARKNVRKRRKLDNTADTAALRSAQPSDHDALTQTHVSQSLRGSKPRQKSISSSKRSIPEGSRPNEVVDTADIIGSQDKQSLHERSRATAHNAAAKNDHLKPAEATREEAFSPVPNQRYAGTQFFDVDATDRDDEDHEYFDNPVESGAMSDDEEFADDINDEEFLKLTSDMIDTGGNMGTPSSSLFNPGLPHKAPIALNETQNAAQRTAKKFVSPVTLTTRLLVATSDIDRAEARKPIVRPPFPAAVRDRSPIIGLSSNTVLRTCFRIGEAINQAHQSSKSGKHIVFELYARIFDSQRDDTRQHFTFCDLFHGKPPYIKALYEGAIWKSVQLFEYDSKRLLQQGRICRCIGTMKREERQWSMTVLNIWESTWEDIKWVEGIVDYQ